MFETKRYYPRSMREPPRLDPRAPAPPITLRYALLIGPFYPKDPSGSFAKHVLTPSQSLTSVAAATPERWTVGFHDENLLQGPPPLDPFPEVVGITVHLTFANRAFELARWYRSRGAIVVMGGLHATACPDEVLPHCDAVAVGDGVALWPRILSDVERGTLEKRYSSDFLGPFDRDPAPKREIVPRDSFLTTASLIATRGCRNRCRFCHLSTRGARMPFQVRCPADVAAELEDTGEPFGVFVDNNLGSRPDYLRDLCRELAPLHKIWSAAVTVDVADDPTLVEQMARAGCTGVFVGLETLNGENLKGARKRSPRPERYLELVAVFHDFGIQVNGSFVFGFDHDRSDVFGRTVDWIEQARLECATFHILTPYPGTPLFAQLEAEGRLLHRDWERYDTAHAVFRPRNMSPERLEAGYRWCYETLFSSRSIWRRRPEQLGDVGPYLVESFLYKHLNRIWPALIRHRLVRAAWRPLIEAGRLRHVMNRAHRFRTTIDYRARPASARSAGERRTDDAHIQADSADHHQQLSRRPARHLGGRPAGEPLRREERGPALRRLRLEVPSPVPFLQAAQAPDRGALSR